MVPVLHLYINGTKVELDLGVSSAYNVLQHCDWLGQTIPRFCYHDKLSIAGNCRMCLVESSSSAKLILACATEVSPELEIYTNSLLVTQAREQMLEFLLLNHPLDCPICDQGGECDLQDLTYVYGSDRSRYVENKRGVSPFYFGPLVKVIMTRCIQCTRCIRFFDEIVGTALLGSTGRGTNNVITTYLSISTAMSSYSTSARAASDYHLYITGNVSDICPVGALTARPSAYILRVWEVIAFETIDVLDSLCSNIRVDTVGSVIVRILPRLNAILNDEWITDKVRFVSVGLSNNRVSSPNVRYTNVYAGTSASTRSEALLTVSWDTAFELVAHSIVQFLYDSTDHYMHGFDGYAGGIIDSFTMFMFKVACSVLGISSINKHVATDVDIRSTYLFTTALSNAINDVSIMLILAVNVRKESPILNIRVTRASVHNQYMLWYIGTHKYTAYQLQHIGNSGNALLNMYNGRSSFSYLLTLYKQCSSCITGNAMFFDVSCISILHELFSNVNHLSLTVGTLHTYEFATMSGYNVRSSYAVV